MLDKKKFYINGEWIDPKSNQTIDIINPATEDVCAKISLGNKEDVNEAVQSAKNAFKTWAFSTKEERLAPLEKLYELYKKRWADIAEAITLEMGAPKDFATKLQAGTGAAHIKTFIRYLKEFNFEKPLGEHAKNQRIIYEPKGVCALITPWNWPMNQTCLKVMPAIASGCTMVLKPSEVAPLSAMILTELIHEANFPKGVFNLVNGYGPIVGAALSEHEKVDMMSFTGSTRAGIAVAQASASTVKRVQQELGGKSANIILDDVADLEKSVKGGAGHCFLNSGQSCNAPTRMLVSSNNYDKAVEVAIATANSTTVGDPNGEFRMGPISNKAQYEKVIKMIEIGIGEGAKLVAGGVEKPEGYEKGYYVKPTVFADVTNDMTIAKEEIFGPVLCLIKYETEDEAIEIANDTEFGLAGYVQGELSHAIEVGNQIRAGQITINGGARGNAAPFGGYKASGNGREHGKHGIEECLETKAIIAPAS